MSNDETDLIERLHAVAAGFEMPPGSPADDVRRGRRRVRRNRGLTAGAAAAAVAVVLGVTAAVGGPDREGADGLDPVEPGVVLGDVVWYDAKGLHRGNVVEQTPVELVEPERPVGEDGVVPQKGALALVRSGAVYGDPATGDVWFHPWGGDPRIVGHSSEAGPGGDPTGDTAAWFEGADVLDAGQGELVIYDTAAGREISRTFQSHVVDYACCEHRPAGNDFLHVSAERVVWTSGPKTYGHDVQTGTTSVVELEDVHDGVEVASDPDALVLRAPGRADQRYPDLEGFGRLSPSGTYVLAVEETEERHGAVIVETRTGALWRVPKDVYPWIAWSYGDIAMVDHTEDELLACDAARRACEPVHPDGPFLLPTN